MAARAHLWPTMPLESLFAFPFAGRGVHSRANCVSRLGITNSNSAMRLNRNVEILSVGSIASFANEDSLRR